MTSLVQNYEFKDCGMKQRKRSTGELISSVTFFGAAVWLSFEAKLFMDSDQELKGVLVYVGAFLSLLAAMRFTIQRLVHRVSEAIWPK
jgi:hypothetical protein